MYIYVYIMHYVMKAEAARANTQRLRILHSAGEIKPLFDDTGAILEKAICIAPRYEKIMRELRAKSLRKNTDVRVHRVRNFRGKFDRSSR